MENFCDQYLQEYAIPQKKAKTVKDEQERIRRTILPAFGKKRLHTIKKVEIQSLHSSMHKTPYEANRVLALMRIIFKYAEARLHIDTTTNPCKGIKPYRERRRERFLSQTELARVFQVCSRRIAENSGSIYAMLAFQVLMLTGARRDEVRTLKWEQIDLEHRKISLTDTKTGNRIIPISDVLDQVLRTIPKQLNNPYVFCGLKKGTCLVNLRKPWQVVLSEAGLTNVRIHDLRHSYASLCISSGKDLETTRRLLGHRDSRTTMQYVHVGDQRLHETSNAIGRLFNIPATVT
jgi:integrase